jgi:hypothetical protein
LAFIGQTQPFSKNDWRAGGLRAAHTPRTSMPETALELHLPEILKEVSRRRAIFISNEPGYWNSAALLSKRNEPEWWGFFADCIKSPYMQHFIFNSGEDNEKEEIEAFHETAREMMEADLFHLPYTQIWIEDYSYHPSV